jgi:hypothetical protein
MGPGRDAYRRSMGASRIEPGDIVRFETEAAGTWFYCRVDDVLDDELVCRIVETQSWPDLILSGYLPGKTIRLRRDSALSVVAKARSSA